MGRGRVGGRSFGVDGNRRVGEKQPEGERSAAVQPDSGVSLFPHYSAALGRIPCRPPGRGAKMEMKNNNAECAKTKEGPVIRRRSKPH